MALAAAAGGIAHEAHALPRYTARYEQKCALCHVNPSGGGLRTTYASQKLVPEEFAWIRMKPKAIAEIETKIAKEITVGADFREFYVGADIEEAHLNFFQMQSDLYIAFQPDPKFTLYYDRGASGSYETFAMDYLFPTFYLKAGRFVPSYGWKFDDHTMFVRTELGLAPPFNSDVGLEAGFSHGPLDVHFGVVNGSRGSTMDGDTKVAVVLNAVYRRRVGPIGAALGATGYHRPAKRTRYASGGMYGYLTWRGLTWAGEVDLLRRQNAGAPTIESVLSSNEFSYLVHRGLEIKATYDFYDPDWDVGSGAKARWGGGVSAMPYAYLALEGLLRRIEYQDGLNYRGRDYYETLLQLHVLY